MCFSPLSVSYRSHYIFTKDLRQRCVPFPLSNCLVCFQALEAIFLGYLHLMVMCNEHVLLRWLKTMAEGLLEFLNVEIRVHVIIVKNILKGHKGS